MHGGKGIVMVKDQGSNWLKMNWRSRVYPVWVNTPSEYKMEEPYSSHIRRRHPINSSVKEYLLVLLQVILRGSRTSENIQPSNIA